MSYERPSVPETTADPIDECAPTERDPAVVDAPPPSRGTALSVLWWDDGEDDDGSGDAGVERGGSQG